MNKTGSNQSMASNPSLSNSGSMNNSSLNQTLNQAAAADIQAQFELLVELRRFMNIDLFQRGYYQIRLQLKCMNKQMPIKILLQLEKNQNNVNLSDSMYPSCVIDDYAVSKTFLILYRNEEILLDDQILFKISTIVNAFNLVESFEKMDLQLNIELWFTENDYKPVDNPHENKENQVNNITHASTPSLSSSSSTSTGGVQFTNLNNTNANTNSSSSLNTNQAISATTNTGMQLLCSRAFKVRFDPRQGIHIQIPVLFDYFHLSAVLCTIHCTLLTLLPPVMLGTSQQRNSTLSTILFGKDLGRFKDQVDVGEALMKRAVHLHNQICGLLLASYENLQDHIIKMSAYLDEFKMKSLDMDYVNCQEKLQKISDIVEECADAESLDDLANRHVAQCSAENIMQWCTYLEVFSLSQEISSQLALEYHNKRLKRFSETFFVKDLAKKNLHEYEISDNYVGLHDTIRQSAYSNQLPDLLVSCDDLDGVPDSIPIIFEDNYVSSVNFSPTSSLSSNHSSSESISKRDKKSDKNPFLRSLNSSLKSNGTSLNKQYISNKELDLGRRKSSIRSNETSTNSLQLSDSSRQLHRKLRKKIANNGDCTDQSEDNSSIQLVSYRKMNVESEVEHQGNNNTSNSNSINTNNNTSNRSSMMSVSSNTSDTNSSGTTTQSKLNQIKAELSSRGSTPAINRMKNLDSITESYCHQNGNPNTEPNKRRVFMKQTTHEYFKSKSVMDSPDSVPGIKESCKSLTNLNNTDEVFASEFIKQKESHTSLNHDDSSERELELDSVTMNHDTKSNEASLNDTNPESPQVTEPLQTTEFQLAAVNNKLLNNLISENMKGGNSGPSDCSFKSRALYESFRGKPSTLERPRQKKPIPLFQDHNSSPISTLDRVKKRISYEDLLSDDQFGEKLTKNNGQAHDENALTKINEQNEVKKKVPLARQLTIHTDKNSLSSVLNESVYKFTLAKEDLKRSISSKYQGNIYSEFSTLFCTGPYFYPELTPKLKLSASFERRQSHRTSFMSTITSKTKMLKLFKSAQQEEIAQDSQSIKSNDLNDSVFDDEKLHLVVCVHGLDGNSGDLRLVRTYLELALPGAKIDFLMSEHNQDNTFDDLEVMTKRLIKEINDYIDVFGIDPERISFIGHSLGNLIVRSTVAHENFKPFIGKLHTYLSLSGPHLGTLYNSSGLINMGMWIMQKWKKSGSLLQLSLKDHSDLQKTFLYKLSTKPTFEHFKNILLVASPQDRYVPFHSARIEICKAALKDSMYGAAYREMVNNILNPIKSNPNITFKRYSAFHCLPSGTNNFIGRAAHIAVLDSELFVEKLVLVSVAKYFR